MTPTSTAPGALVPARLVPAVELKLNMWFEQAIRSDPTRKVVTVPFKVAIGLVQIEMSADVFRDQLEHLQPGEHKFIVRHTQDGLLIEKVDLFQDGTWKSVYADQ